MYLMNRKMIFGERYHPKKNFISSKIKFFFLFGSFGALLATAKAYFDMNLYDSGWNRQTDFSLVLVLLVVPLVLVLPLIVPWRVSRGTSFGISLSVMFYLEQ